MNKTSRLESFFNVDIIIVDADSLYKKSHPIASIKLRYFYIFQLLKMRTH